MLNLISITTVDALSERPGPQGFTDTAREPVTRFGDVLAQVSGGNQPEVARIAAPPAKSAPPVSVPPEGVDRSAPVSDEAAVVIAHDRTNGQRPAVAEKRPNAIKPEQSSPVEETMVPAQENIELVPLDEPASPGFSERPKVAAKDDTPAPLAAREGSVAVFLYLVPTPVLLTAAQPPGTVVSGDPSVRSSNQQGPSAPVQLPELEARTIEIQVEALPAPIPMAVRTTAEFKLEPVDEQPLQPEKTGMKPAPLELVKTAVATIANPQSASHEGTGADDEKQSNDPSHQLLAPNVSVLPNTSSRFDTHLAPAESPAPIAQQPDLPAPGVLVARRVSIDIGEADSRVTVTLHERAGEVSVKIHASSEPMKAELQSSIGSLVEALRRENVSLANMDFTSGYGTAADRNQSRGEQHQPGSQSRARRSQPEPQANEINEENLSATGIHFRA